MKPDPIKIVGSYESGILSGRSTTDHIFTLRVTTQLNDKMKLSTVISTISVILVLSTLPITVTTEPQVQRTITYSNLTFTRWPEKVIYQSSTQYNARGMAPIYKIIDEVLRVFIGTEAIPK
uniref:Uncharacterized protein n=1 Tax=Megaselia scalaris TaxID=36166 RepID=T1GIV0_MEGSC